ncbi:MAG TPA: Rho termination factor N-terminal domain-containing protein [Solirubrobacterales bacterium]
MNKAELESKHIAELHALAAEAGVPKYRMLRREELIEALANGDRPKPAAKSGRGERKPRERRPSEGGERASRQRRRRERPERESAEPAAAESKPEPAPEPEPAPSAPETSSERPRRRRRRRFGRRRKGVGVTELLLPPSGRQALVYGESPEACTATLREIAGEISAAAKGPDPIALLVDPSPEELAEWKREAPEAELVAAAQARHASDALAQAVRRAEAGEDVILLVDSLTRLEDADVAKEIFDGAKGALTVVAALVRD